MRNVLDLYLAPSTLFANQAVQPRSGRALILLCLTLLGIGYLASRTGAGERFWTLLAKEQIRRALESDSGTDSQNLDREIQGIRRNAAFWKQLSNWAEFLTPAARCVLGVPLLSALLFLAVAGMGNSPNQRLLTTLATYCWYVEIPRQWLRLTLLATLGHESIETSAAAFVSSTAPGVLAFVMLRLLDPFEIWFWVLLACGLVQTGQMRRRQAIGTALLLAFLAGFVKLTLQIAWLSQGQAMMGIVDSGKS